MTAPAIKQRAKQIREPLEKAIRLMIEQGRPLSEAAAVAEMREESLQKALRKEHVKAFTVSVKHAWLTGETLASWHTVSELRKNSPSDKVRLEASRTFIGAAGELQPEQTAPPATPMMIQIVCNAPPQTALASTRDGVIELDGSHVFALPPLLVEDRDGA